MDVYVSRIGDAVLMKKSNWFNKEIGRFTLAILLITWAAILLTLKMVDHPEVALDFIKWVFITYSAAGVSELLLGRLSK